MSNLDGNHDLVFEGLLDLESELREIINNISNPLDILENGAKEFTKDLLKLPKPKSEFRKSGYTHLIDTFSYRKTLIDVEVGWGKYYGRMVENGTRAGIRRGYRHPGNKAQPHLVPLWDKNQNKYYEIMLRQTGLI